MRILLLSDVNSVHTRKWAVSLKEAGIDLAIFSLAEPEGGWYQDHSIPLFLAKPHSPVRRCKPFYLFQYLSVKAAIDAFQPELIHAHYASSYGLLGALSGFHPFILSVWGSDVFDFPGISFLHRKVLEFNLSKADKVLSTSKIMAKETAKYINREIEVIPFGTDINLFKPQPVDSLFHKDDIVIGAIKALEPIYGLSYLIKAFKRVKENNPQLQLKLLLVGSGHEEKMLKQLVNDLSIQNDVVFTGKIEYSDVPRYHNMISIYVALSTQESFGVSIIEAQATGKPVVVSNIGGLPEVVVDGLTGIVVEPKNPEEAARALESLIHDNHLRETMGKNGRERIVETYNWNDNLNQMITIYRGMIK
ncbi:MAG: glycosyltransferase [Bacteroidales bacterium]|nr:glycosyltransferase [Bacteroidales bacterium]